MAFPQKALSDEDISSLFSAYQKKVLTKQYHEFQTLGSNLVPQVLKKDDGFASKVLAAKKDIPSVFGVDTGHTDTTAVTKLSTTSSNAKLSFGDLDFAKLEKKILSKMQIDMAAKLADQLAQASFYSNVNDTSASTVSTSSLTYEKIQASMWAVFRIQAKTGAPQFPDPKHKGWAVAAKLSDAELAGICGAYIAGDQTIANCVYDAFISSDVWKQYE